MLKKLNQDGKDGRIIDRMIWVKTSEYLFYPNHPTHPTHPDLFF